MSGDYTRFTFDPAKVFSGVHKQQGRVSLDADFNEFEEILDRRDRSEMYDTVGHAVVPATTPDGFKIDVTGGKLTIGIGRMYVDGLQPECFGDTGWTANPTYDAALGNLFASSPLPLEDQPFHYANAFPGIGSGINLVYLDVWQREVTSWEDDRLIEPALGGPDTATRVQTAWQVKALSPVLADACTNPPQSWLELIASSTARMTATASGPTPPVGPCVIQPAGGYLGMENRLYRVEIQKAGTLAGAGAATFTWSRDNASFVASVLGIKSSTGGTKSVITVDFTGRDTWTRFEAPQTIELLGDDVELAARDTKRGGWLAQIENVNHATGEILVGTDLSGFLTKAGPHPRIRRWDTSAVATGRRAHDRERNGHSSSRTGSACPGATGSRPMTATRSTPATTGSSRRGRRTARSTPSTTRRRAGSSTTSRRWPSSRPARRRPSTRTAATRGPCRASARAAVASATHASRSSRTLRAP